MFKFQFKHILKSVRNNFLDQQCTSGTKNYQTITIIINDAKIKMASWIISNKNDLYKVLIESWDTTERFEFTQACF